MLWGVLIFGAVALPASSPPPSAALPQGLQNVASLMFLGTIS